jgi:magnesium-transporting ATPase (P-type)
MVRYPFSSSRKRMTTQVKDLGDGKGSILLLKGASEIVMGCCDKFHNLDGDVITNLDEAKKTEIKAAIKGMA